MVHFINYRYLKVLKILGTFVDWKNWSKTKYKIKT